MTKDEFKENINGILIELTETNSVKYVITNYYIRIYDFYKDISDYLLTLHDYLTSSGFEDVEFEIWVEEAIGEYEDKSHYVKVQPRKRDLSKIRKDITLFFKNTNRVITESKFVDQDELDELLDKISEFGIESISDLENKRLNIFSENDKSIIELIDKMGDITYDFKILNKKMKELSSEGKDAKYLMKDWLELNRKMVPLEREIESYGIMLGDPRLTRLMKKERPDVYGDICESNKFENVKDVITNMNGILVDLKDHGFSYEIYPSDNDIKLKMVSFAKEKIKVKIELLKKYDKSQIFDIVYTLNDYMESNNFKTLPINTDAIRYKRLVRLNFNSIDDLEESDLDIVTLYLEYENMDKLLSESISSRISDNLEGLIVDLEDYGFECELSGNKLKLVKPDIMFGDKIRNIFDSILTIVDFMESSGYKPIVYYNEDNRKTFTKKWFEDDINSIKLSFMYYIDSLTIEFSKPINESLPRENTVKQLKRIRKISKGTDIGDRISDMNKQGANIDYINNPIDTGVESYEDYEKRNKGFIPSWNLKHLLDPYQHSKKKKKKKK